MKNTKINAGRVWKDLEDLLAAKLGFSVVDRAVYSHLLRHSRLEGVRRLRFSLGWLSRGTAMSRGPAREAVRRLVAEGLLVLLERNCQAQHVVQVRLPHEVRSLRRAKRAESRSFRSKTELDLNKVDFMRSRALRQSIHAREAGRCFYCLRRIIRRCWCLDHVVPQAQGGGNSYQNLVSCCLDCNIKKTDRPAGEFLRWLFREGKLGSAELRARFRALRALKAGKLVPQIKSSRQTNR